MKVIKIDSRNKTITELNIEKGIQAIYKELECQTFSCIELPNGDTLFIDDEGLLVEEPIGAFSIRGAGQIFSGHGLVIGTNHKTGDSIDCKSTISIIEANVTFEPVQMLKGIPLQSNVIPLSDKEMDEYFRTGKLPIGKTPPNPQ